MCETGRREKGNTKTFSRTSFVSAAENLNSACVLFFFPWGNMKQSTAFCKLMGIISNVCCLKTSGKTFLKLHKLTKAFLLCGLHQQLVKKPGLQSPGYLAFYGLKYCIIGWPIF